MQDLRQEDDDKVVIGTMPAQSGDDDELLNVLGCRADIFIGTTIPEWGRL